MENQKVKHYLNAFIIFLSIIISTSKIHAQIGLRVYYNKTERDSSQEYVLKSTFGSDFDLHNPIKASIDYKISLTHYIKIVPEFGFYQSQSSTDTSGPWTQTFEKYEVDYQNFYLNLNYRIYPFTQQDSDSIETNWRIVLLKGLYFTLSHGISHYSSTQDTYSLWASQLIMSNTDQGIAYNLGIGTGIDIKISNHIMLNPYFRYDYYLNEDIIQTRGEFDGVDHGTGKRQVQIGLRIELDLNQSKY